MKTNKNYYLSTKNLNLLTLFNANIPDMKNRRIEHARNEVRIYENYYKPSLNLLRFTKSILGVLILGRTCVAEHYVPVKKRTIK